MAYSLYCEALSVSFKAMLSEFKLNSQQLEIALSHELLTSACCVDSNIYGLGKIHCIRYITVIDSCHTTSPAIHKYYHLISGSVEVPTCANCIFNNCTGNSSFIGEEPVPNGRPDFTSSIRRSATSSFVSYTQQGIGPLSNVLQGH